MLSRWRKEYAERDEATFAPRMPLSETSTAEARIAELERHAMISALQQVFPALSRCEKRERCPEGHIRRQMLLNVPVRATEHYPPLVTLITEQLGVRTKSLYLWEVMGRETLERAATQRYGGAHYVHYVRSAGGRYAFARLR